MAASLARTALSLPILAPGHVAVSARPRRFLQPPGGPLARDVTALVRPELQVELRTALYRAFEAHEPSLSAFVPVQFNGAPRRVALLVQPRPGPKDQERMALVVFLDGGAAAPTEPVPAEAPGSAAVVHRLQEELRQTQMRLCTAREEYEASNEDLRAANEELQSLNEEYRTTAEELETSKEELQSINEEIQTVNLELKHKLEEISRAHSDLENLMAATEIGTLFLDRELRIQRFTPPVTELFSITSSDCNRPITDFTHRLDYTGLDADARRVLRDLAPIEREAMSRDGQRWYLVRLRPYRTVNHRIEGVVVTLVDITASKRAEAALRQSEARFRALIEASAQIVWATDAQGQVTEDSPSWRAFTGQSLEAWLAGGWVNGVHPEERAQAAAHWRRSVETQMPLRTECRLYHAPSGEWRWTQVHAVPLRNQGGAVRGWIGMNSDITEQKNAAAALAQQAEQLQQQDRQKNRFLGLLGHELRNPLAAISNTIEVLRLNTLPADRQRQGIDIIHRQVTQLRCLVDDLLNISRINQGQIKLRKTRLAVADSLASAVEQIRPQIEARHHRLELELPEQPLYVEADPARLTQIVANLLSNAAHYTEDGGTLTLTARRLEDQALIRVRDTGMGIAPERLPHLFTAFGPMEATAGEHHAGLGMGLALARQLAELHGGSLEAASAGPGQGSEFTLRLPALPEGQIAEPAPLPADTGTEIPARRILLVEDEKAETLRRRSVTS